MSSGLLVSVLVGGLGIGGAVGYIAGAATKKTSQVTNGATQDTALFVFEKETFNTSNLPSNLQTGLYQADLESFNQKQAMIREFVVRMALAKEQKKFTSVDKLPPLDELLPAPEVSDADAKAFFEANKDRVPPGTTFEQLSGRIKELLGNEKRAQTFNSSLTKLQSEGKIQFLAKEPTAPLVTIPVEQYPAKGSKDAKDVLVEISDYLCPHCKEIQPQIQEMVQKMGSKVKFVQINFALRPDKLSGAISEGAFCAQKQSGDAFWKYHEAAFAGNWGTFNDGYDVAKVKPIAEKAGLDIAAWESCMASSEPKEWAQKTRELVNSLGVSGTPTFFFNNRRVNFHHPAEIAKEIEEQVAG